jgi:hypothetical protein
MPLKNSITNVHKNFCGTTVQLGHRAPHCWGFQHTHKRARTRQDSSGRVIGSSQRHTTDEHSFPQRGSNPKCQQSSGIRPTPWTARPPVLAVYKTIQNIFKPPLPTSLWTKKLKFPNKLSTRYEEDNLLQRLNLLKYSGILHHPLLTIRNSTLCPYRVVVSFVWFGQH